MALTVNAKTFNVDVYGASSVSYNGPANTVSTKDTAKLVRTNAKASDTFSGVARTQAKFTRTLALTGAKTALGDAIVDINIQVPVGFAAADMDSLLNDAGSFLSSASAKTLAKNLQITY